MSDLKEGEKIGAQGDGWEFIVHEETHSARFHLDQDKFEPPHREDGDIWLTRKSDGQKFFIRENNILEVKDNVPVATDAKFVDPDDPGEYYFMQSIINDDMFILHKGDLYQIDGAIECTGDENCEHCSECPECASLHCDGHENNDK
jgi:hypothetical protein